ncbi:MAG: hypothetical protein KF873_20000 [Gemmataceae bacterium]|nr:hypothetical protein [Gemmataceae bacterium]
MLARTDRRFARRRGAILLVTLTLLALFSVVALSFALYAESHALGSRTRREAVATEDGPPPVDLYASAALGQMLYGEPSASYGIGNNLLKTIRGHEDSTMVYGDNPNGGNTIPYNGVGQFSDALTLPTATGGTVALDRRDVINYALQFPRLANGNFVAAANHVVDPSHSGFRTAAQLVNSPGDAVTFPTKAYVARNAPYTYVDRLNVKVAMQDPNTGRILVPSFHRPSLFGSLDRTNGNWRDDASTVSANFNAAGRYKILRPRPWDHRLPGETEDLSQFPFPPANPDGTITGDVQNIAQTDGRQQNDSVWVDMGLPPMQWRGRWIQPLVAATILPLDGRVNVNVAGNASGGSTNGFGPWEIGLSKITTDATAMVNSRTGGSTPSPRGTNVSVLPFASSVTQSYAAVNWDGNTVATPMTFPAGNQSDPTYPAGFDSATASNTEASSHPGLFLPYTWNAFSNPGKLFPHTDLRRSAVKYAGKPNDYLAPYFGATAPGTLTGTGPGNQSALRRTILTTASNSLHRPQLMPMFADSAAANLAYDSTTGQLVATAQTLTNPVVVGTGGSDFGGALNVRNALANLGPVNLNRPLADYRAAANPTNPLSPTNLTNFQAATNDRQTLARDIFVRLIVATGAKAIVNPTAGTVVLPRIVASAPNYDLLAPGDTLPAQYDALRYLAQLAANIVDTIDNDDIATQFVWNPTVPGSLFAPDTGYSDMTALFGMGSTDQTARDAYLRDRVVIGVEKPRVVINEVYSEVTNAPSDSSNMDAMEDFHVRFWIELINTANTGGDATAPLGDGSVSLTYAGSSPYKVQVFRDAGQVRNTLYNPANPGAVSNITGRISGVGDQKIDASLPTTVAYTIEPNNGNSGAGTTTGFRVLGPDLMGTMGTSATEFLPNTAAPPYQTAFIGTTNGGSPPPVGMMSSTLAYAETRRRQSDIAGMTMNRLTDQAVVLRRLANPYLAANDPLESSYNMMLPPNPYVTVDVFTDVTSRDAIRIGERDTIPGSGMRPMGEPAPANTRSSKGRMAPHYAYRLPLTGGADTTNFVQAQTMPDATSAPGGQLISFFNHNNQRTGGAAPAIEWLAHFDRPLVNQTELQMVAAVKPHELTYRFTTGTAAAPTAHQHVISLGSATVPLYRALEALAVKPWGYGIPAEGRVPGKININMIWNRSVFEALLDQNGSNTFTPTDVTDHLYYNQTTPTDSLLFGSGTHARTKDITNFAPGNTIDETGLATDDRPFKSFGTAAFSPGGLVPAGSGLPFTLLRDGPTAGTPAIFTTAGTNPYQRAEMLRKMFNSVTTTSDTYLVVMTVGFFEVRNTPPFSTTNPLVLGKEVHDQSAGDLRGKFVAILDRSMMATDIAGQHIDGYYQTTLSEAPYQVGGVGPYYCRFSAQGVNGTTIQMVYEGRIVNVPIGGTIIVGTGANAEQFVVGTPPMTGLQNPDGSIAPTFNPATGLATVILTAAPTRLHHAGDSVSNGIHQNPGAQPNFDVNSSRYKGVVPYFERVEIGK